MGATTTQSGRTMSEAAKRRISIAAKERWARYRAGRGPQPNAMGKKYAKGARVGVRCRRNANGDNPYLRMSVGDLCTAHVQLAEAMDQIRQITTIVTSAPA